MSHKEDQQEESPIYVPAQLLREPQASPMKHRTICPLAYLKRPPDLPKFVQT